MIKTAMVLIDNFKKLVVSAILALSLLVPAGALAIPSADLFYNETDLGGGWWQYDYTVYNTSDPFIDSGYNLYEVDIYFPSDRTFESLGLPADWEGIGLLAEWADVGGIAPAFSVSPGIPPGGADLLPGASLSGFSFRINFQLGNTPFDVYLTNPMDSGNPELYSGTSASATPFVPVSEPDPIYLLMMGLMLLVGYKGWMVRKERKGKDT